MIRVNHPGSRIMDPGVKKAPDPISWIRIRNTDQMDLTFVYKNVWIYV